MFFFLLLFIYCHKITKCIVYFSFIIIKAVPIKIIYFTSELMCRISF